MKRVFRSLAILIFILIIVSNTPPIRYLLSYAWDFRHYRYSNASGTYTDVDKSGNHVIGVKNRFNNFLLENETNPSDTILYRTFWRNPLTFWRYWNYGHEKYDFPYRSWSKIKAVRQENKRLHPETDTLRSYQRF